MTVPPHISSCRNRCFHLYRDPAPAAAGLHGRPAAAHLRQPQPLDAWPIGSGNCFLSPIGGWHSTAEFNMFLTKC